MVPTNSPYDGWDTEDAIVVGRASVTRPRIGLTGPLVRSATLLRGDISLARLIPLRLSPTARQLPNRPGYTRAKLPEKTCLTEFSSWVSL